MSEPMELTNFICPDSPYVWNRNGVSECFDNLVLGFGANILTVVMILAFWVINRRRRHLRRVHLSANNAFSVLAALGLCFALFDIVMLLWARMSAQTIPYHEWLYASSEFLVWMAVVIMSRCETWSDILCNGILCVWWIIKLLLLMPRLQIVFTSPQVIRWIREICGAILDITFATFINIIRVKVASYGNSSVVDPLLPYQRQAEEGPLTDSGIVRKTWHLMTFKTIDPVIQHGSNKQLDLEDLLQLPIDMDPSSCHNLLLKMWDAQQANNLSHPSLFKAICSAYGWPYFCIGVLKDLYCSIS